jgi:hypothetical protein
MKSLKKLGSLVRRKDAKERKVGCQFCFEFATVHTNKFMFL